MSSIIVLDRDGVINQDSDAFVKSAEEWIPIPGSIEAIARLSQAGYTIAVATNQSGIGRGLFTRDDLADMHQKMNLLVEQQGGRIELIAYCPHAPDDGCDCRKPKPGLFRQIENALDVTLQGAWSVGDSLRDLQASVAVGAKPVLVLTGKGKKTQSEFADQLPKGTQVLDSLEKFAEWLLPDQDAR